MILQLSAMIQISAATANHIDSLIQKLNDRQREGVISVGVFDSGAGGLTALPSLSEKPQHFDIHYRGDTAHFPYGEKTDEELVPLVIADLEALIDLGCSVIGIACNTASVIWRSILSQGLLQNGSRAKAVILDTISATLEEIERSEPKKTIGIIATNFTVQSGAYEHAIRTRFTSVQPVILQSAEQPLITAIEKGDQQAVDRELRRISEYFSAFHLDLFILGCTHYSHLAKRIESVFADSTKILDTSVLLGRQLRERAAELLSKDQTVFEGSTYLHFTGEKPPSCVY